MDNFIDNEYIDNAINDLINVIGIEKPISGTSIFYLIEKGHLKNAIEEIAKQLNLPIKIEINKVPSNYKSMNGKNYFRSSSLVKTKTRGTSEGIIAQVDIPSNLPFYGSPNLNDFPINVKISDNCIENPKVFTLIMSHELSHVLLHSINYKHKDNEYYTDITAMLLGFLNIFENSRKNIKEEDISDFFNKKTRTSTTTYGYLSDEQFELAKDTINSFLYDIGKKRRFIFSEISESNTVLKKYKEYLQKHNVYFNWISKNHKKNVSEADAKRIVTFFVPGYTIELENTFNEFNNFVKLFNSHYSNNFQNTKQKISKLDTDTSIIKEKRNIFEEKLSYLISDVRILNRHVNLKCKLNYLLKNKRISILKNKSSN